MYRRHAVDMQVHQQPLFYVQFPEGKRLYLQEPFQFECSDIMVQVNNSIKLLLLQIFSNIIQAAIAGPELIDLRVMFKHHFKIRSRQKMHFRPRHLLFEATDNRRGKDDIANRTETDKEEFRQGPVF